MENRDFRCPGVGEAGGQGTREDPPGATTSPAGVAEEPQAAVLPPCSPPYPRTEPHSPAPIKKDLLR